MGKRGLLTIKSNKELITPRTSAGLRTKINNDTPNYLKHILSPSDPNDPKAQTFLKTKN